MDDIMQLELMSKIKQLTDLMEMAKVYYADNDCMSLISITESLVTDLANTVTSANVIKKSA